jgi:hypothetical protein
MKSGELKNFLVLFSFNFQKKWLMKLLTVVIVYLSFTVCNGQTNSEILDYNNVSALLLDEGVLFSYTGQGVSGYEIPKGGGVKALNATSFWYAGVDENGILRVACAKYNLGNDFFSGPISSTGSYSDPNYLSAYSSSIWTVTKQEVNNHIQNYLQIGYVTPNSILHWPGNGIASLGIAEKLAPFIDVNGNNIYEPLNGDYPNIRGDKASYIIINDMANVHTESGGEQLGIEVHVMAYQFTGSNYIDSTTFLTSKVYNRGSHTFSNFKVGMYLDADLGNYADDYYGCDSTKNLIYTYNSDSNDESNGGVPGYGLNPPSIGVVSLNHQMSAAGFYSSYGGFPYSDPNTPIEYWNFLNASWADGSEWYFGGLGYAGSPGATNFPTNYLYSGNPYTGMGWSEATNSSVPGDRRMFMALDPISLIPNKDECYDFAIIYNRQGDNLENVQGVIDIADSVKQFFDAQTGFTCHPIVLGLVDGSMTQFSVFPNPSTGKITVVPNGNLKQFKVEITDLFGREVYSKDFQGTASIEINLEEQSGMYLVSLISEGKKSTSYVVIEH